MGTAPTYEKIAEELNQPSERVLKSFINLNSHHMIFLEPGSVNIRMANPFSAIPTRYIVRSGNLQWWANCAWDSLGIAAATHRDVVITAGFPDEGESIELTVENGVLDGKETYVYFALPCDQWYDDLIYT